MGKSTISMAIFNSYVSHYQRVWFMDIYDLEVPSGESVFEGLINPKAKESQPESYWILPSQFGSQK